MPRAPPPPPPRQLVPAVAAPTVLTDVQGIVVPLVVPGVETIGTDRAGVVDLARPASIREGAGVPDRRARSVTYATSVPTLVVLLGEHAAASEALERGERADGVGRGRGPNYIVQETTVDDNDSD